MNTAPVYASAMFEPADGEAVSRSLANAIDVLEIEVEKEGREIIWDTLEISIEREFQTDYTIIGERTTTTTWHIVHVNALGLKRE